MSVVKLFNQKKKKNVATLACPMVKFSMTAILDSILHLTSQTMYFGVSIFFKYTVITHPKYVVIAPLQAIVHIENGWYSLK